MWILLLMAALLGADQLLKYLARQKELPCQPLAGGQIHLMHLENDGLVGGRHRGDKTLTTVVPVTSFLLVLTELLPGLGKKSVPEKIAAAMVTAGGIGNLLDRLVRGSVTDYIRFPRLPWKKLRALVWNLADLLLLLGGVILTVCQIVRWFGRKKGNRQ